MASSTRTPEIQVLAETDTTTFTIPDRLTIEQVAKRRAAYGSFNAGVAAAVDVELFKGRTHHSHKGKAKRWDRESSLLLLPLHRVSGLLTSPRRPLNA